MPRTVKRHLGRLVVGVSAVGATILGIAVWFPAAAQVASNPATQSACGGGAGAPPGDQAAAEQAPGDLAGGALKALRFTATAGIELIATDNALESSTNRKADFISAPCVAVSLNEQTRRARISANASAAYDFYKSTPRLNGHLINGIASASTDILPRYLTVDFHAATNQQAINPFSATPGTGRTFPNNQTQTLTYGATPTLHIRFGGTANLEGSYDLGVVSYFAENGAAGPAPFGDSIQQTVTSTLSSGSDFERVTWTIGGSAQRTYYTNGRNSASTQRTGDGSLTIAVYPNFQIVGTGGYDAVHQPTLTGNASGVYVTGGLRWSLTPRTRITFDGGRRYNNPYYSGQLTYGLMHEIALTVSYRTGIQTPQSLINQNLQGITSNPAGILINPNTGLPANPTASPFGITNQAFRDRTLEAGLQGKLGRNNVNLTGTYEWRDTGIGTAKSITGSADLARELATNLTAGLSLSYTRLTSQTGLPAVGSSQTVAGRARLDYRLGSRAAMSVYYYYQRFTSFPAHVRENGGVLTLTRAF